MIPVAIITATIGSNLTIHAVDIAITNGATRTMAGVIAGALLLATLLTTLTLTIEGGHHVLQRLHRRRRRENLRHTP